VPSFRQEVLLVEECLILVNRLLIILTEIILHSWSFCGTAWFEVSWSQLYLSYLHAFKSMSVL